MGDVESLGFRAMKLGCCSKDQDGLTRSEMDVSPDGGLGGVVSPMFLRASGIFVLRNVSSSLLVWFASVRGASALLVASGMADNGCDDGDAVADKSSAGSISGFLVSAGSRMTFQCTFSSTSWLTGASRGLVREIRLGNGGETSGGGGNVGAFVMSNCAHFFLVSVCVCRLS